jgi:hypothetical protein
LLRLGLLAAIATQLVILTYLNFLPVTTDFSRWYAPITPFVGVLILGLALFGFRTALMGRSLTARTRRPAALGATGAGR